MIEKFTNEMKPVFLTEPKHVLSNYIGGGYKLKGLMPLYAAFFEEVAA